LRACTHVRKSCAQLLGAAAVTVLLSVCASALPLEEYLSMTPFYGGAYPWRVVMPYWRVAVAMLYLWLASSLLASRRRMLATWLTATSAVALATAHYLSLIIASLATGLEVSLYPLFYTVKYAGGETLHLDVAQLILLLTAANLYLTLGRPPRTASSGQRTPSRSRRA